MRPKLRRVIVLSTSLVIGLSPLFAAALMTSAEFQKYIDQINAKAAVNILRSRRALPVKYTGTCPVLLSTLSFGMQGADVRALQTFLISQSTLSSGSATGYFGRLTQSAVQAYQQLHSIVSSGAPATTGFGAVGPKTRAAISGQCKSITAATQSSTQSSPLSTPATAVAPPVAPAVDTGSPTTVVPTTTVSPPPSTDTSSTPTNPNPPSTTPPPATESTLPSSYITCGTIQTDSVIYDQDYSYVVSNFVGGGDTIVNPENSNLVVYENGLLIGPGNSPLSDVRTLGQGAFSHWNDGQNNWLYFSTSDNTDPTTNGKTYTYGVSSGTCPQ